MEVKVTSNDNWLQVKKLAFRTIGKDTEIYPTSDWKYKILRSQHSPIRSLVLTIEFTDIPYWVVGHFVRHKIGCEHYVKTQRSDRTGIDRDDIPQGALVDYTIVANSESLINISRKRLCTQASLETRNAWVMAVNQIALVEPELARLLVPECVYRGFCPEFKPCGYSETENFIERLIEYQNLFDNK